MWRAHDLNPGFLKPGARYTQSDWFINNKLVNNRSELQRAAAYQTNKDLHCARGDAHTQIRWAIRSTKNHLTNRVEELSLWRNQSEDSIALVDKEIAGLEQVKTQAEQCLQDGCVYRLLLGECVTLRDGRRAGELVHDHVEAGLRREVELTEEMKEQTQKNLLILLDQLRDLRNMRALLTADDRDKGQAAELNGLCLSFNLHSPNLGYKYQPCHVAKGTVSYSQWTSHCRELKQTAEKLSIYCGQFRATMQYTLSKLMSALETQRCATDFSLRRRVEELSRAKESLDWERQQVEDAVVEMVRDKQNVELQVMTSGSEQQVAHSRLDTLAQRPNQELCMDQPHVSLLLEIMNLSRNTYFLKKKLALSERSLEALYRNLMTLDEHLDSKAHSLDIDRQCLDTRRRLVPPKETVVVNSPRLQVSPPRPSSCQRQL